MNVTLGFLCKQMQENVPVSLFKLILDSRRNNCNFKRPFESHVS